MYLLMVLLVRRRRHGLDSHVLDLSLQDKKMNPRYVHTYFEIVYSQSWACWASSGFSKPGRDANGNAVGI
jgi:hypothetical protein